MSLLVDYTCTGCGVRQERWVAGPPPGVLACVTCGADARRAWSPVGLSGRGAAPAPGPAASAGGASSGSGSPCREYPQIPGICHMTPSAQRRMVAAYTRNGRALDAELRRQEAAAATQSPVLTDAISHFHQPATSG